MAKQSSYDKAILYSLGFTSFAQQMPGIVTGLLLIEIAKSFGVSIGVMGQMRTIQSGIGILIALLMGVVSIRYPHKRLLVLGVSIVTVSSIGLSASGDYIVMLFFSALMGIGGSISGPMISTLLGEHVPPERVAEAVGLINGSAALAYLIGSPSIAYLSDVFDWRRVLVVFVAPLLLLAVVFDSLRIPLSKNTSDNSSGLFNGYRIILRNKSALACLAASVFSSGIWVSHLTFSASYIREIFLFPKMYTSLLSIIGAGCYIAGSLYSGKLSQRIEVKRLVVYTTVPSGLLILLYLNAPSLISALLIGYTAGFCNGVMLSSIGALNLSQVPEYRGTMMSLSAATGSLGSAIAVACVGWLNVGYGYGVSGLYMAVAGLIASVIYHFFVSDLIV